MNVALNILIGYTLLLISPINGKFMTTEIQHFEPQGNVRGVAIELVEIKGKNKRVAHAYLPTNAKVEEVSVDIPRSLKVDELRLVAQALLDFVKAMESA